LAIQIQLRRATASEWTAANPVLAVAEMALETDTNQFKIGDGSTAWNSLEYGGIQGEQGSGLNVASTQPVSPSAGDLWLNDTDGQVFVYYDDGTSQQWIPASSPTVTVSDTAPTGYEGQLWLDSTDGSMYVNYTDPGSSNSSWIGAVSRSGGILQVVSSTHSTTVTTTSTSYVSTNLTASITPSSTSNRIIVLSTNTIRNNTAGQSVYGRLFRGTVAGTAIGAEIDMENSAGAINGSMTLVADDSPNTTSTQTYTYGIKVSGGTGSAQLGNLTSQMILMEVAG
jgi:hypothetical protein